MLDQGNAQLSAVGTLGGPWMGGASPVSTGGGGGGVAGEGPFELQGEVVKNCCVYVGRTWVYCQDVGVSFGPDSEGSGGFLVARIDHSNQTEPVLYVEKCAGTLENGPRINQSPHTSIKALYYYSETTGLIDLRAMPTVPAYM